LHVFINLVANSLKAKASLGFCKLSSMLDPEPTMSGLSWME